MLALIFEPKLRHVLRILLAFKNDAIEIELKRKSGSMLTALISILAPVLLFFRPLCSRAQRTFCIICRPRALPVQDMWLAKTLAARLSTGMVTRNRPYLGYTMLAFKNDAIEIKLERKSGSMLTGLISILAAVLFFFPPSCSRAQRTFCIICWPRALPVQDMWLAQTLAARLSTGMVTRNRPYLGYTM